MITFDAVSVYGPPMAEADQSAALRAVPNGKSIARKRVYGSTRVPSRTPPLEMETATLAVGCRRRVRRKFANNIAAVPSLGSLLARLVIRETRCSVNGVAS